ncbi:tRNA preQ1(34) S-adenosylmethionine ribosyltransferase-isomerase QueA [Leptolyngbya sp. CCNP1308]|uniref:tRNA preQ1(34) S-adenosylmethionine ribosyltransferase-isomerase QueA n=1 Tax=Leptolyngbya sp. CCNP1308 TaxID=3110255 RepID=UPI002B206441|nr:tRNA preQ1(34) S-adenosylmethionine ribosyltransferase-isomerase QueA [Leptolyngbya sp. CCNP1308]MEA5449949.1 tRNA preQ1(34) S-adenosylmethionine ribosyltransferase-isomerase QueA [Leptolyngbya sp. CCNP1308]
MRDSQRLVPEANSTGQSPSAEYSLAAYQYSLPPEKIAQTPVTPRDSSRLLVVDSPTTHAHHHFRDLPTLLQPGDLLVVNDTRVIPARLPGYKPSGAQVEVFLLEDRGDNQWLALVRPGRRLKPGATVHFGPNPDQPDLVAQVLATDPDTNGRLLKFEHSGKKSLFALFERLGEVPLPPYITDTAASADQYQTVYAEAPGAVAAPTAGLHFTPELFERLEERGVGRSHITLHVGVGTFRPVEADNILDHKMHGEWIDVSAETVEQINATKARGGRVIAVGTTAVRALEGAAQDGELQPWQGKTNLFIYPGYQYRVVDGLITNFHLPGSSLLMLVSALVGRERLLRLYEDAIAQNYRFYSFGDAMLILPEAVGGQSNGILN